MSINTIASVTILTVALSSAIVVNTPNMSIADALVPNRAAAAIRPLWISAYYAIWVQQSGELTPQQIDFTAMSHIMHFHITPEADGTIDPVKGGITAAESEALLTPAHAAKRKVLICVGGGDTAGKFRPAISDAVRPTFIANLMEFVKTRGYDGIDIDMEPVEESDVPDYSKFIRELRTAINADGSKLLLTAAVSSQPTMFATLAPQFDQVNIMTYDLSGTWTGWKTWHNSPLYDGGSDRLTAARPYPSVQANVQQYLDAGLPASKTGIGAAFYGYIWNGADAPGQGIQGVTYAASEYHTIMDQYGTPDHYHWDKQAHAPYLSISAPNAADRKFISYDNEKLLAEKVAFARQRRLGGLILWELGSGYRNSQPDGKKDGLLQAVKRAWLTPATK